MRFLLLSLLLSLFALYSSAASDVRRVSRSQPRAISKAFYSIFPAPGTNYETTASFVRATVGSDDLKPWTDLADKLVSWTVEADDDQVAQLSHHAGITRVTRLDLGHPAPTSTSFSGQPGMARRADEVLHWLVVPTEASNEAQVNQTTQFLKSLTGSDPKKHFLETRTDFSFWSAHMTKAQADEAARNPGIKGVGLNVRFSSQSVKETDGRNAGLAKRDISYATQKNAPTQLAAISQPSTVPNLGQLKNYVYESHSGEKSFIYHFEYGVAYVQNAVEFPHVSPTHVQTEEAKDLGWKPEEDHSTDPLFHSTCTASKALGQQDGAAKKATLVVVQLADYTLLEMISGFVEILADIRSRPERRKFSVVSMSLTGPVFDPNNVGMILLSGAVERLMSLDVAIIVSAGNEAKHPGRSRVDTVPAVFAADTNPVIVVGSVNAAGDRSDFSQTGPQVTTHAIGEDITCIQNGGAPMKGTSFSTPLVAGEIANLLSLDPIPFDTSDGNVVQNLRRYLATNAASGWERRPGIRVLWNGVTEANNPVPNPPPPPPPANAKTLSCHGLSSDKYLSRETLRALIATKFCPDAAAQARLPANLVPIRGVIERTYNPATIEEVTLGILYPPNLPSTLLPDSAECVRRMLDRLTDGCDANGAAGGNPANYKGGGTLTAGHVSYVIQPKTPRQPARLGVQGGCDSTWKAALNEYTMWGHGWAGADNGTELKAQIGGCARFTWWFEYGLGSDGREWTAKFKTGALQRKCVGHAAVTAGAPAGFGCSGTG